jgi:hypothetical protein
VPLQGDPTILSTSTNLDGVSGEVTEEAIAELLVEEKLGDSGCWLTKEVRL